MSKPTKTKRLELLHEAEGLIAKALDCLEQADLDEYTRCTMMASLEHLVGRGGWLTRDLTLADLREEIEQEDD
jgi:hypothetical protein